MKYLRNGRRLTDDIVQSKKQEQQLTDAMLLQKEAILNENRASHVFHRRSSSVYNNTRSSTRASQRNSFMLHRPSFFYRNRNPEPNAIYIKTIASDHNLTDEQPSEVGSKDFEMPDEIALRRSSWKPPKLDPKSLEALCKKYFDEGGKVVVEIDEGLEAYQKNPEKLGKILKKRVHEAFMADFWALHYHYPKETHPKPGNGITRPPPSAKNFRLSPSEALDLSRRTKALAKPKHVTNNRTRPNTSPDW
ncbi:hypothetical protein BDR26DRAFT_701975 [Obelidium mucronatum]|nr:hypothetical protein BDR26DRAFT_701975 [Obelidium mucronatum]